jgi:tetratricopeptide (TPR) repeat protein
LRIWAASVAGFVLALGAQAADAPDQHATVQDVADALHAGQPGVAEREASVILDSDTIAPLDRAHTLLNRGLAREALGKQQDALSDFNNAIWLNILSQAEKARALFDRGVMLDELGRTADAVADYSAALVVQPDYAAALNDRANAERRLGKLAEAKADYEASLAAGNTEKKYPYFGLGEIAMMQGDTATAAHNFRAALKQDASYTVAAQRLASLGPIPPALKLREPEKASPLQLKLADAPHLRGVEDVPVRETKVASLDMPRIPQVTGGTVLQLGAFRSEADARTGWKSVLSKTGDTLDGIAPAVIAADVPGKGHFWRLRVGPLDKDYAASICGRIKAKDADCIPVRD